LEQYPQGNNSKASVKVNVINGCSGDCAISEMRKSHFEALYNSVDDNGEKEVFLHRMSQLSRDTDQCEISVRDNVSSLSKQKTAKQSDRMVLPWKPSCMVELVSLFI